MRNHKRRDDQGFDDQSARLLTILLGWLNLIFYSAAALSYNLKSVADDVVILPVIIINLTLVIALTLLTLTVTCFKVFNGKMQLFLGLTPSLLVTGFSVYLFFSHGFRSGLDLLYF